MKIHSEQEMLNFGQSFADKLLDSAKPPQSHAIVVELIGDVGAGKTTFTRGLAKGLGLSTQISSPSFTISKSYPLGNHRQLVHYDFYRLSDPGIMASELAESIKDPHNIIVIEWGDSVSDLLHQHHTTITISYTEDDAREITLKS